MPAPRRQLVRVAFALQACAPPEQSWRQQLRSASAASARNTDGGVLGRCLSAEAAHSGQHRHGAPGVWQDDPHLQPPTPQARRRALGGPRQRIWRAGHRRCAHRGLVGARLRCVGRTPACSILLKHKHKHSMRRLAEMSCSMPLAFFGVQMNTHYLSQGWHTRCRGRHNSEAAGGWLHVLHAGRAHGRRHCAARAQGKAGQAPD